MNLILTKFMSRVKIVIMKIRYLHNTIKELAFSRNKMAFISGPRQCGKTTLAKRYLLEREKNGAYFNWDNPNFRRQWVKDPLGLCKTLGSSDKGKAIFVFDEIHKAKGWKRNIKGLYDSLENPADLVVTGNARLNVFKKGSDSLLGRYLNFRLHPFTLAELLGEKSADPGNFLNSILANNFNYKKEAEEGLEQLFELSGFPEPLFDGSKQFANIWRSSRTEKIVREDLRDISRIPELSQVEMLIALLPERIGAPFSKTSLREDLEVSFDTVKRWVNYLMELYYLFEIKPYSNRISRSLKKEGKIYLWDYTEIENEGYRFENMIAVHLLKACNYWSDIGYAKFELFYLRNKEKEEIDFLITKDKKPWLPIEVKSGNKTPSRNWLKFLPQLNINYGIQVVRTKDVGECRIINDHKIIVVSASTLLSQLV